MQSPSSASPSAALRAGLALLLLACLVHSATGSCLSYGHSCWGAHGKRSGKPPAAAPDWFLGRALRRAAADLNRAKNFGELDEGDIYRVEENAPSNNRFMRESEEVPLELESRAPEAKPMLDDNALTKMKLWQIMRAAAEEQ